MRRAADKPQHLQEFSAMRPFTALAVAAALTTAGPALAGEPHPHGTAAVHHEAKSEGGAPHALTDRAGELSISVQNLTPKMREEVQVAVQENLHRKTEQARNRVSAIGDSTAGADR